MIKQGISENQVNTAFLGIGSNIGNKKRNIEKTKFLLQTNSIKILKCSNIYESYSWPNKKQPKFYNIVIKVMTNLKPANLLYVIKNIEKKLGRKKALINEPRICDIDILDYKGKIYKLDANNNKLIIPHPRLQDRNFVLFPLAEICPDWEHPVTNEPVKTLIEKLSIEDKNSILKINKT